MKRAILWLMKRSALGRPMLLPLRLWRMATYLVPSWKVGVRWLLTSREYTNFTYDLTALNRTYLAHFVADATGRTSAEVLGLFNELENDSQLAQHYSSMARAAQYSNFTDPSLRPARRLAWYALVRILKPRLVVETGVDKGLGSCIITSALLKNRAEGFAGSYLGTDINPAAGFLLSGKYAEAGKILYGDSLASLRLLEGPVDIFINDSDHSSEYEAEEYRTIASKLSPNALLLGDNSHGADSLVRFAESSGRRFKFFQEQPESHWIPGAGIGLAYTSVKGFQGA